MNIYVNFKIRYNHNEEGLLNLSHSFIFLKLDFHYMFNLLVKSKTNKQQKAQLNKQFQEILFPTLLKFFSFYFWALISIDFTTLNLFKK